MKKINVFVFMLLIAMSIFAQEKTQLTEEQVIEITKQECINSGISKEWFGGNVRVSFDEKNGWFVFFEAKPSDTGFVAYGNHLSAFIAPDGQVGCFRGM